MTAVADDSSGRSRVLQRSNSFPLPCRKIILFTGRQQPLLIRSVLSAPDDIEVLLMYDAGVCVTGVDHIGVGFEGGGGFFD